MLGYERGVTESPDRESESRADEYTRNFLEDEALPTIWQELAFHRRFIPTITLAEMTANEQDWVTIFNIKRIEDAVKTVTLPDSRSSSKPRSGRSSGCARAPSARR